LKYKANLTNCFTATPTQPAYCATVAIAHFSTTVWLSWDRVSKALDCYTLKVSMLSNMLLSKALLKSRG